jgi:4-carboxymuconolactone decarboxylase
MQSTGDLVMAKPRFFALHVRSLINLGMLSAMGRWGEFALHVRGALNNGVTEQEIAEVLLQAGVYAGVPVAAEGFKTADRVIREYRSEERQDV